MLKPVRGSKLSKKILVSNVIVVAIQSVAILAPIYAGIIEPELRATCITLVGVINVGMVGTKVVGTFLSVFLLLPASYMIVTVAKLIP